MPRDTMINLEKNTQQDAENKTSRNSNILSKWLHRIFCIGIRRPIDESDLQKTCDGHRSDYIYGRFDKLWRSETVRNPLNPSLVKVITQLYGMRVFYFGLFYGVLDVICRAILPLCLGGLILYFRRAGERAETTEQEAYYNAGAIVLCVLLPAIIFHPFILFTLDVGMKIRLGCSAMLYRKALRMTKAMEVEGFDGELMKLMTYDVTKFESCISSLHDLWKGPLEILVLGYFIYQELHVCGLLGIGFLLIFIPVQCWMSRKSIFFERKILKKTNKRLQLMEEIIEKIQDIKINALEKPFEKFLNTIRKQEMKLIRGTFFLRGTFVSFSVISKCCIFISLVTNLLFTNEPFTARKVFVAVCYFHFLYISMLHFWTLALYSLSEGLTAIENVRKFLLHPETKEELRERIEIQRELRKRQEETEELLLKKESARIVSTIGNRDIGGRLANRNGHSDFERIINRRCVNERAEKPGIVLEGATAMWWKEEGKEKKIGISNVSASIESSTLCALIGPPAAGKSSLLQVILGELQLDDGFIHVNGRLSYASQQPWIFDGRSVKENILFAEPWDEERYNQVITVCDLKRDLIMLPHGDETLLGVNSGFLLSDDLEARLNLARAIYKRADIYLLDDPLSRMGTHSARFIFENCIRAFLKQKCCVLISHQMQFLEATNYVLSMSHGRVEAQGTFEELRGRNCFTTQTEQVENAIEKSGEQEEVEEIVQRNEEKCVHQRPEVEFEPVGIRTLISYLKSVQSVGIIILVIVFFITSQITKSFLDYFLASWASWEESFSQINNNNGDRRVEGGEVARINTNPLERSRVNPDGNTEAERHRNILIYTITILVLLLLTLARSFSFFQMCLNAAKTLHNTIFRAIIRAKMVFFHDHSSAGILKRFSVDVGTIDVQLPVAMMDCLVFLSEFIGVVTLVAIVNYWLLVPTFIMALFFLALWSVYARTARSVKGLELSTRRRVFTQTAATLQGLATIRTTSSAQQILIQSFDEHQDLSTSAWSLNLATTRAFAIWSELLCVLYTTIVTFSFLVLGDDNASQSPIGANVGLAVTQVLTLTFLCQWGMRQLVVDMESQLTSVERVVAYANRAPAERPLETIPKLRPEAEWPPRGRIEFVNFSLKEEVDGEENGKMILHDINLIIQPKEKVAIVGRNGRRGNSSIIQALFQFGGNSEGRLEIDGINVETLGLNDLRSKISIIRRESGLFSGTLRQNLDPREEHTDDMIWRALEQVELKAVVSQSVYGLACDIGEMKFSASEKRLICLAGAILRNNRIVILDEVPDKDVTDKMFETTIRNHFSQCTVLRITNRLHTVMHCDKVLVMGDADNEGRLVEFGHPYELIQKSGAFKALIDQTGSCVRLTLIEIAKRNYTKLHRGTEKDGNEVEKEVNN